MLQNVLPAQSRWNSLTPIIGPHISMIDQIAKLLFLPVFSRWPVAVFYEVDRCNMGDRFVRFRIEKNEWLIPVSIYVLNTICEVGLHSSAVVLSNLFVGKSGILRTLRRMK